ncbi:uncharacterized protein PpBr36_10032 [Pyricularia pennisetigena]|uniref:uncharacterized protein n=1 Tax=Pyricularia pennisetigena TaxID=1578925 RepID=UPI0011537604|nr:uncharacterized protein PpBr36_10032 [Pyricularia pennisetigena]TLS22196.1 hypothetical protein PpBr36_10032 [Pyricularia pennisetigena]
MTEFGEVILLPAKSATEIRHDPRMNASAVIDLVTEALSSECELALKDILTDSPGALLHVSSAGHTFLMFS